MAAKLEVDIIAQLKEFNKGMSELKSDVKSVNREIQTGNRKSTSSANDLGKAFSNVGKTLGGLFAVDQLMNFAKGVISTTAEFQKMEAVLTTALGDNSAARVAMSQISEFASKTPFQVNELTDAFVKLTNQGFRPTMAQMTSMGDLAASTGKSFDQLAEAVIDAQTGEFERLKEFGIRAKSEGDRVIFTFKGISTEVAKTDKEIRNYIVGLGNAEGVSGSMASISDTVGGKISNLGDNFTMLQKVIGDSSGGLIAGVLDLANSFTSSLVQTLDAVNTVAEKTGESGFTTFFKRISAMVNPAFNASLIAQSQAIKKIDENSAKAAESVNDAAEENRKLTDEISKMMDSKNKEVFANLAWEAEQFNRQIQESLQLQQRISSIAGNIQVGEKKIVDVGLDIAPPPVSPEDLAIIKEADNVVASYKNNLSQSMMIASEVGGVLNQVFTDLANGGKNAFQIILQAIKKLIVQLAAAVASAFLLNILTGGSVMASGGGKGIGGLLKGAGNMGLMPFANGGIVSGPTPALVGEYTGAKTNPEVIAPLNKLQNMMGGNVTFTISGDNLVGTLNRANKTRSRKF